jgi:hypothetical protein
VTKQTWKGAQDYRLKRSKIPKKTTYLGKILFDDAVIRDHDKLSVSVRLNCEHSKMADVSLPLTVKDDVFVQIGFFYFMKVAICRRTVNFQFSSRSILYHVLTGD